MEERDSEVPLGRKPKIAITYNLKKGIAGKTADAEAEYDHVDTVCAIEKALRAAGCDVTLVEADAAMVQHLQENPVDMVFNIAEGLRGRGREAEVPAVCNMLGIPYTGSDETTLSVALDKALTKRLVGTYRVPTPRSVVYTKNGSRAAHGLHFPVIVKPNAEGSSKGVSDVSVVETSDALRRLVNEYTALYDQDMLAEEYIEGREFTVGVLGNGKSRRVFAPMEIIYQKATQGSFHVYSYNVKQNYTHFIRYECPARLDAETDAAMRKYAGVVCDALGCRDFARVDFRLSSEGKVYFIEINPLPGLAPGYSDYPMLAEFCGVSYNDLIAAILRAAAERCGVALWERGDQE